jgi:hypothetical protein
MKVVQERYKEEARKEKGSKEKGVKPEINSRNKTKLKQTNGDIFERVDMYTYAL